MIVSPSDNPNEKSFISGKLDPKIFGGYPDLNIYRLGFKF